MQNILLHCISSVSRRKSNGNRTLNNTDNCMHIPIQWNNRDLGSLGPFAWLKKWPLQNKLWYMFKCMILYHLSSNTGLVQHRGRIQEFGSCHNRGLLDPISVNWAGCASYLSRHLLWQHEHCTTTLTHNLVLHATNSKPYRAQFIFCPRKSA